MTASPILDAIAWRITDANERGQTGDLPRLIGWCDYVTPWIDRTPDPAGMRLVKRPRPRTEITARYRTPAWVDPARDPHRLTLTGSIDDRSARHVWHDHQIHKTTVVTANLLAERARSPVPLTPDERSSVLTRAFEHLDHHRAVTAGLREVSSFSTIRSIR